MEYIDYDKGIGALADTSLASESLKAQGWHHQGCGNVKISEWQNSTHILCIHDSRPILWRESGAQEIDITAWTAEYDLRKACRLILGVRWYLLKFPHHTRTVLIRGGNIPSVYSCETLNRYHYRQSMRQTVQQILWRTCCHDAAKFIVLFMYRQFIIFLPRRSPNKPNIVHHTFSSLKSLVLETMELQKVA